MYTLSEPVYTDGMRTFPVVISTVFTLTIGACGDSASETTVVTTVITTAGTDTSTPEPSTSTTGTGTTESSGDTDGTLPSTGGIEPTSAGTTGSTTAYEPPSYCIENDDGETSRPVTCEPVADSWCAEIEAFAAEHLPEPYATIAVDNCEATGTIDPCGVCFYIVNTCAQVAGPCDYDHMIYECGCLAHAHGVM